MIEVNIGNVYVQLINCIDVNVVGGLYNQCMNYMMVVGIIYWKDYII